MTGSLQQRIYRTMMIQKVFCIKPVIGKNNNDNNKTRESRYKNFIFKKKLKYTLHTILAEGESNIKP